MKQGKRIFCLALALISVLTMLAGCDLLKGDGEKAEESIATEATEAGAELGFQFTSDGETYYLWDDGVATTEPTYSSSSNMTWEKDTSKLELVVRNKIVDIVVARYAYRDMPTLEKTLNTNGSVYYLWSDGLGTSSDVYTEDAPYTWNFDNDVYHVFNANGSEVASFEAPQLLQKIYDGDTIYYLWNSTEILKGYTQGICTTTEEFNEGEGLRWTQPWDEYYMIYAGDYTEGHVVYTEHACSSCDVHKIYYTRTVAEGNSLKKYFFCTDCKLRFEDYYHKCPSCGTYWCYKSAEKCDYCIANGY